jgi:hypothetical protein
MKLDPALWAALEDRGVSLAHLEMLLRVLETQRNGCWAWHYVNGHLTQCDLRLTFPSRRADVTRVSDALLEDNARYGSLL